ncbi:type IX secretion system sortase PorU [Parabacteroides goldsteinii]|uniref:type IX secretion system sortase PorU n=1 Tax=Parabacteroides goldsteinii TaxID=328812 RepID=UPI002635C911|nr:type IX secretion system sortase PorU [Parabacteroides goldsteinii]
MELHETRSFLISGIAVLLCLCFSLSVKAGERYTDNSVLSKGNWVKIQIEQDGIYKLTYSELKKMGFDDPSKVSVYGYGGWPLEEDFTKPYVDDLPAVPVLRKDDYILFYGRGTTKWEAQIRNENFTHTNNPYSVYGYYFLTDGAEVKVPEQIKYDKTTSERIETFDDYLLHEKELVSINLSGRRLFEKLSQSTQTFNDFGNPETLGIVEGEIYVDCKFVPLTTTSEAQGEITLSFAGNKLYNGNTSLQSGTYTKGKDMELAQKYEYKAGDHLSVKLEYKKSQQPSTDGYVDYIRLNVKRQLKTYNEPYTFFRSFKSRNHISRFVIEGANSACMVMDITDPANCKIIETELTGSTMSFTIPESNSLREFVLIRTDRTDFPVPVSKGAVECRNLHGWSNKDMIIISPSTLRKEAERLKEAHETQDGLRVEVVTPEEIYNEFSSGTPDATAYRRFMKMLYDKAASKEDRPKYLLLFGDGAYDNRFVTESWSKMSDKERENFLLTFQSENSLDEKSYVTDDYFGFLDDASNEKSVESCPVDIGIGRFPIRSVSDARKMVNKVIRYMNNEELGIWKSETCFVADDGGNADKDKNMHMEQADAAAKTVERQASDILAGRLFFDNYVKDFSSSNPYEAVTSQMNKKLREGLSLINYTGHGNTTSWSDEKVLTQQIIDKFSYSKLPLWITATCDFCRFDALATSAGESIFLNEKSGGIALYTTVRVAYADTNEIINRHFLESLFTQDANGQYPVLGDVVKETKRKHTGPRNLNFTFIGDPAIKLNLPTYKIRISTINGKDVALDTPNFRAYDEVVVEGEILSQDNLSVDNFNGKLDVKVMDSKISITTRNNFRNESAFKYEDYKNLVYKGSTQVQNGKFSFSFYVPGNISYSGKTGKMILYASDSEQKIEAKGNFTNYKVQGTSDDPLDDHEGPEIVKLYLNDSPFVSGDKVNTTPFFYARLWDQTGVDITEGGVGHDVMLMIDNKPFTSYNLNSYYDNIFGRKGEGEVRFGIPQLSAGMHEAVFKVWDVMGNPTTYTFRFEVDESLKPFITNIVATPTPAKGNVEFHLTHNRPESQMKVGIMVYDIAGRLHWKHEETGSSELFKDYVIDWDLRNNSGSHVRPGVYIYRAAISTNNSKEATEAKKMIILW